MHETGVKHNNTQMHTKQTELAETGRWSLKGPKPGKEAFFTPLIFI